MKKLAFEEASDQARVEGDLERVRQIIYNRVNNAYNYTPEGGHEWIRIKPTVSEGEDENGAVQVDVQDNGIGIQFKDQVCILERFYRGEDPLVLATAGTGLGLSISKNLVEMHRGKIWFSSSGIPGEGSMFAFTLPVHQVVE